MNFISPSHAYLHLIPKLYLGGCKIKYAGGFIVFRTNYFKFIIAVMLLVVLFFDE